MKKVITYGTYDLLHYGHIRLLERAKSLGDYLIVGITSDDYDKSRGKINVHQSLIERIEAVKATGFADEIIIEEYEGQKIDDIKRLNIDIFTVGSDWEGHFDYLNEYCKVIYLDRTEGISSSEIRSKSRNLSIGLVGESIVLNKFLNECNYVNGISVEGIFTQYPKHLSKQLLNLPLVTDSYETLLKKVDAIYITSQPNMHYEQIKQALNLGKHVLCESPISTSPQECEILFELARKNKCILQESIKTAYSTAYSRLLLLVQSGAIGDVISIDSTCTSLRKLSSENNELAVTWNSICAWGPTALLPIFQLLGSTYKEKHIVSHVMDRNKQFDYFSKIDFLYDNAVASIKVGKGVKSEGELVISGTDGYIYVPAPWWKTEYFEIRYENPENNKRYFYQLDGEGIRYEIVAFTKAIEQGIESTYIKRDTSIAISTVVNHFEHGIDTKYI